MSAFLIAVSPFALNAVMWVVKRVGASDWSTPGKRFLLAAFAILGVVAGNWLNGSAVDANSVSDLVNVALESFGAFLAAHGSYNLFWKKAV